MRVSVSLFRPRVTRKGVTTISKIWNMKWLDPITGRRTTKTTGTDNKQAAQQFASEWQEKLYQQLIGSYDPAEDFMDMLFKTARDKFLEAKRQRLRPESVECTPTVSSHLSDS